MAVIFLAEARRIPLTYVFFERKGITIPSATTPWYGPKQGQRWVGSRAMREGGRLIRRRHPCHEQIQESECWPHHRWSDQQRTCRAWYLGPSERSRSEYQERQQLFQWAPCYHYHRRSSIRGSRGQSAWPGCRDEYLHHYRSHGRDRGAGQEILTGTALIFTGSTLFTRLLLGMESEGNQAVRKYIVGKGRGGKQQGGTAESTSDRCQIRHSLRSYRKRGEWRGSVEKEDTAIGRGGEESLPC